MILLVEDEDEVREVIETVLRSEGYDVTPVRHGREALDVLRRGLRPCIIILDLMMPVMDGWELWRALGEDPALSSVPLVVISGGSAVDERAAGLSAAHTLKKPVDLDDLLDALARLCP